MTRELQRQERRAFMRTFVALMVPSVIQNVVSSSLFIVDNLMIGNLGPDNLAAVTQANQLSFLVNIFIFGVASGATIFSAQYWGKQDMQGLHSVLGLSLCAAGAVGLIGFSIAHFFPWQFMRLYSQDETVVALGVQYLSIVKYAYLIIALNASFAAVNKSTERVRMPMAAALCALATTTALNYCLIFGNFFFPRMGLRGGAVSTVIAAGVECAVLLSMTYLRKYPAAASLRQLMRIDRAFVLRYVKTTTPVLFNEGLWGLGTTVYAAVYGTMGTATLAAVSIAGTLDRFMFMAVIGVVHASSIMVGKFIGAGDMPRAYATGRRALLAGTAVGFVCAGVVALLRVPLVGLFNMPQEVSELAMNLTLIIAAGTTLRCFNFVNIVGILRAGGDTVYSMGLDLAGVWGVSVPLVCAAALWLDWPILWVMPLVYFEDILKAALGYFRFRSRKWMRNLVGTADS